MLYKTPVVSIFQKQHTFQLVGVRREKIGGEKSQNENLLKG